MQVCNSDRPASLSCYVVAGRLLFVQCDSSNLGQLLEHLFAGWQLAPVEFQDRQPQVHISCHCNAPATLIPPGYDRFEIAEQAQCYVSDGCFLLDLGDSSLQLTSKLPVDIQIWFKTEPESVNANLARTLSFAVCAGLRRHGLFDLHGAGLLAPDSESGVLIIGPSGGGKSTLATQLVATGWSYLSDDELLLTLEDDKVIARGFRSFFALSAEAIAATGVAIDSGVAKEMKARFEPGDVFGQSRSDTAIPRALFFTSVSSKVETQVAELSRTETMTRLLRACPWATYDRDVAAENLHVLSSLARQSKGFDLVAGRDLLEPGYADTLLRTFIKS
jgi:hypothetical protein